MSLRKSSVWVVLVFGALSREALAADPTTADCLAASEASLRSGNGHKLREERNQLLVCAAPSCPADIRKECMRRIDEVNLAIPTVVFEVKDAAGNDLSAVRVLMDGELVTERLEGIALSLDPGEHVFSFETQGQAPMTKKLLIREAEKERREAVRFGLQAPVRSHPVPMQTPTAEAWPAQRLAAVVAGAVGVVGLGVGSAYGLRALSKKSDAEKVCADTCSDAAGVEAWRDARSAGNMSTLFFIVGGAAVGAGVALWFTAPKSPTATQVGLSLDGVRVRGAF